MASVDETRLVTAVWAPGAVTANHETNLPANYPEIEQLLGGLHISSIGDDYTGTDLTAIAATATPGAGNISQSDGNTFRIGTACDTKTKLIILYRAVSAVNDKKYVTAHWAPGVVTKDNAFDMPAIYPEIEEIIGGVQLAQASDVLTTIVLTGAAPAGTLGAGNVSKVDGNSIKMGDDNGDADLLTIVYRAV
jgi:hypothetical protein